MKNTNSKYKINVYELTEDYFKKHSKECYDWIKKEARFETRIYFDIYLKVKARRIIDFFIKKTESTTFYPKICFEYNSIVIKNIHIENWQNVDYLIFYEHIINLINSIKISSLTSKSETNDILIYKSFSDLYNHDYDVSDNYTIFCTDNDYIEELNRLLNKPITGDTATIVFYLCKHLNYILNNNKKYKEIFDLLGQLIVKLIEKKQPNYEIKRFLNDILTLIIQPDIYELLIPVIARETTGKRFILTLIDFIENDNFRTGNYLYFKTISKIETEKETKKYLYDVLSKCFKDKYVYFEKYNNIVDLFELINIKYYILNINESVLKNNTNQNQLYSTEYINKKVELYKQIKDSGFLQNETDLIYIDQELENIKQNCIDNYVALK